MERSIQGTIKGRNLVKLAGSQTEILNLHHANEDQQICPLSQYAASLILQAWDYISWVLYNPSMLSLILVQQLRNRLLIAHNDQTETLVHPISYFMGKEGSMPGVKRPEHKADQSLQVAQRSGATRTLPPYADLTYRDTFTFTIY
jgi:hypothetical protein